jgi:hypothetical protein
MGGLTIANQSKELTLLNVGFADLNEAGGLSLLEENDKAKLDKYRFQLYHKVVIENGNIKSMEGKTLLETGCGRGGGLNYLAEKLKP